MAEDKNLFKEQIITDTLEVNYMPYAMSAILSRAIPEIDGFKPSHRKLLYTMYKKGLLTGSRTKSANVVGETMGLNPHGDQAIYETMVRMTRGNGSLLHPYVDSKGNFGKHYSRDMAFAAKNFSKSTFSLARQFAAAETIVIAAPYWDLMFPSVVKTYLESVTVNGLTFAYGENGIPYGLCKGKRLIYVTTAGGPIFKNFGFDYVCTLAHSFYGINDVKCISAEKLDIRGANAEEILRKAKEAVAL